MSLLFKFPFKSRTDAQICLLMSYLHVSWSGLGRDWMTDLVTLGAAAAAVSVKINLRKVNDTDILHRIIRLSIRN